MKKQSTIFAEFPDVLDTKDVCKALGIGRAKVYKLIESGKIHSFRIGSIHKIPKSALIAYVEEQCRRGGEGE